MFKSSASEPDNTYIIVSALFTRLLALVYFAAFASLSGQITALAGPDGILPLENLFEQASQKHGWEKYFIYPTIFWFNAGETALTAATWLGCALSVFVFLNYKSRVSLIALYLLYLSLFHAGQIFMNFQWDYLLMEAGFLAIFLRPDAKIIIFLYRWLLFRLRFLSGLSKIVSNDPSWAGLSALTFYFETQPLPHVGAWYAHHLPEWILILATAAVLVIELAVPFMMFMSRKYRFIAAWLTIGMQLLIILTSNHNWFNVLTIVLCLFLFDDKALKRALPASLCNFLATSKPASPVRIYEKLPRNLFAGIIILVSSIQLFEMATGKRMEGNLKVALDYVQRWSLSNKYHVFPTVEQKRIELVIEGTMDGVHWLPYEFKYKMGRPDKNMPVIIPHHPRIDWMMWFVQLNPIFLPWFEDFLQALLDSSESVTAQLEHNPFSEHPPSAIRVLVFEYSFTSPEQYELTGYWWNSTFLGPFSPLPVIQRQLNSSSLNPAADWHSSK